MTTLRLQNLESTNVYQMTQPGTKEFAFCAFIQKHSIFYCKKWLEVCCVSGRYSVGRTVASRGTQFQSSHRQRIT